MRKKNHLPLFRDDLSTFDDFFQSTFQNALKTSTKPTIKTTVISLTSRFLTKAKTPIPISSDTSHRNTKSH